MFPISIAPASASSPSVSEKPPRLGAQFTVAGADGRVKDVFRITRVDQVVDFFPDVDSACAALGARSVPAT